MPGPGKPPSKRRAFAVSHCPPPSTYYSRLIGKAARVDIWHTAYNHPMADAAAIVEWVKGTGLGPYLDHVGAEHRDAFLADYLGRVEKAYPKMSDGRVLLRFPRDLHGCCQGLESARRTRPPGWRIRWAAGSADIGLQWSGGILLPPHPSAL